MVRATHIRQHEVTTLPLRIVLASLGMKLLRLVDQNSASWNQFRGFVRGIHSLQLAYAWVADARKLRREDGIRRNHPLPMLICYSLITSSAALREEHKMSDQPWLEANTKCRYCGSPHVLHRLCIHDGGWSDYQFRCADCKRVWIGPIPN
jgi:hypothetical protein